MSNKNVLIELGKTIRAKRKQAGYTQEEFAHLAGFERAYYGRIERGVQNVTILNLYKVAKALRCHPSDLLPTEK